MDENITTTITPYPHNRQDALKAVLLVSLFILTFLSSIVPFALRRAALQTEPARRRRCFVTAFSMLSCFGGGVFLATCLLDLLPDSIESIDQGKEKMSLTIAFPLAELLVCIGFFVVLSMEQTIMFLKEMNLIGGGDMERLLGHDNDGLPGSIVDSQRRRTSEEPPLLEPSTPEGVRGGGGGGTVPAATDNHFHPESHSTIRAVLLVFALSLHAVFEGLSMGMQSSVDTMLQVFIALCIHKSLVGFSLGLRLVQSALRAYVVVLCCVIFASMTLVGGFSGLFIMDAVSFHSSAFMVSGCMQAVACGTFLYITLFEILPHELNQSGNRPLKMLSLFAGFGVISAFIALWPDG